MNKSKAKEDREKIHVKRDEDLIIISANVKKLSPEKRKRLLDVAKIMFAEDFKED